ncbi:MAG: MFS transporter [Cyclobacteriaceae bacterium]|nr:MFS transporter [Cyclobacteriaceae bacterium]
MRKLNDAKIINAWCMYDWSNSVYNLVITSAIFPSFYQTYAVGVDGSDVVIFFGYEMINSVLYSYALAFSFLLVTLFLPLLSGIADYSGNKKIFMKGFTYLGSAACIGLFFFDGSNIEFGIICSMLASIGYAGSLVFYDAYLPEIASKDRTDQISARGYSMGYLGSVLLLVSVIVCIVYYDALGFSSQKEATRMSFLVVGLWWALFAQIPFYYLPTYANNNGRVTKNVIYNGYREILKVWSALKQQVSLRTYLLAFFFYNMGVQTVMLLAATFAAKVIGMKGSSLVLVILVIQLVAIVGANLFARLSRLKGNKFSLQVMVLIWIMACFSAYFVYTQGQFFVLAVVVGLIMGGIQALSRATYSKLIPDDTQDHASYFSFYDITYNISVVLGTFTYGVVEQLTREMRNNALVLTSFFIAGFIILYFVKMPFNKTASIEQD